MLRITNYKFRYTDRRLRRYFIICNDYRFYNVSDTHPGYTVGNKNNEKRLSQYCNLLFGDKTDKSN